jgi:hypothetical protein
MEEEPEAPPDVITLEAVAIEPNNCALEEPLSLTMDFTTAANLLDARWEVKFMADQANKRKIVVLGTTPPVDYPAGTHQMTFAVDEVDVSHLKRHVLANVGLLIATLYAGETEIVGINMVTQISAQPDGGLVRSVFSPLD